jgi:YgiT-type zinc finger domain-containing protein
MQQKMSKCIECGSKDLVTVKKNMSFNKRNPGIIKIDNQKCIECKNCGEIYFDEKQSAELARKIDERIKKK